MAFSETERNDISFLTRTVRIARKPVHSFDRSPMHSGYLRRRLLSSHLALELVEQCHAASRTLTDCNE